MNHSEWILCERSNRWLAAIRKALQRDVSQLVASPRLREVRNLADVAVQLEERPDRLVLIEVHHANFSDLLSFLSDINRSLSFSRIVALLDAEIACSRQTTSKPAAIDRQNIADILLEAGAAAVVDSPRQLSGLFDLAERHAATWAAHHRLTATGGIVEQAWASLPWQDT